MKEISYKDPYETVPVIIAVEDDEVESMEQIVEMLNENTRLIQNLERKERYHTKYHLEGLEYEGEEYGTKTDIMDDIAERDEDQRINEWLFKSLTATHYRRFMLFMYGMSIREIARKEGVDYSSVEECIRAAQKKLKKLYGNAPSDPPY